MIKEENKKTKTLAEYTTDFKFFRNTPLLDFNNTIHFKSNAEREEFFWERNYYNYYQTNVNNYNFVKSRNTINVGIAYELTDGYNYLSFYSEFEDRYYYAFIMDIKYINDMVCQFTFVIDTIMTFTQGHVLNNLKNVKIERQHLSRNAYNLYLPIIRNNDDIIKANSKMYKRNKYVDFGINYILFESSVDLSVSYGTTDDPKLKSSTGTYYDNILGATKIYVISYQDWQLFLGYMKSYPWITQNFNKIKMIPKKFIDSNDLVSVEINNGNAEGLDVLYTLKDGGVSTPPDLSTLDFSFSELQDIVTGNDSQEKYKHLVRNEYLTIEIYDMQGNSLFLDSGKIDEDTGLKLKTLSIIGYDNNIKIYPENYSHMTGEVSGNSENGAFLTQSLTINTFTELPIMLNTGELSKANQANQRNLQESRLVTNRIKDFGNGGDTAMDKLSDAVNVGASITKGQLWGKMNDEYEFYQQQQADYKDMALQPPTITSSTMGNAFLIANDLNGITLKMSAPISKEKSNIKTYYDTFGFGLNFESTQIDNIESMTIMNYLKISGSYLIDDIPINLYNQLNATLETGVKFWHNNNTANPFTQNILDNDFAD